ncbi:hypothetical protein PILCRDRAFT_825976 [Piloderma croceum F 1598]|uniref:Uncharacterized protein n=1 Tax=Piloderma croceum (strain F 1598) TaxID=765440 RepID=A0A0C3EW68_PILCF|nr:hypothetical protein PILCRDRAFT_825976 [Piloderma croceum F 1598]
MREKGIFALRRQSSVRCSWQGVVLNSKTCVKSRTMRRDYVLSYVAITTMAWIHGLA